MNTDQSGSAVRKHLLKHTYYAIFPGVGGGVLAGHVRHLGWVIFTYLNASPDPQIGLPDIVR